ncbi:ROK family glucokinase [Georgenia satyanarayanai]|uniref:ROK family glucokinase n=1 Tax=Georgenia satyanarayanai TaxID=860221 RepID=UPI00203B84FC|nr:ROK family glucokinase [Georgenia satyanarayanai]MCM3660175.1 ROK family glucokinase [Georgenia satyanarayanai]
MTTIGIDIGGTKIAAGVVDETGRVLAQTRRATDALDPEAIESAVIACVAELRSGYDITGVGVAAAGFVSPDRDGMRFAPNIAWRDYPLRDRLARGIEVPIVIENDANAAGWAEFRFGAGRNARSMVMLTLGTGLGGAIVLDDRLLRGAFGAAAELGHMRVVPSGHYCGCGHEGCWEMYASGRALTRAARNALITDEDRAGRLRELAAADGGKVRGQHVTLAAAEGDPLSRDLVTELGRWVGAGIADLVAVLDPELFVIGGGVADTGDLVLEAARASFRDQLSARGYRPEAQIVLAEMGSEAGIVGAADLVRH